MPVQKQNPHTEKVMLFIWRGMKFCRLSWTIINETIYCDRFISQLEELHQTLFKKKASLITWKRVLHLYVYNAPRSSFLDENDFILIIRLIYEEINPPHK